MLSDDARRTLLALARDAVAARAAGAALPRPALDGELARLAGAFVTLRQGQALRGCIGHIEPNMPLGAVIVRCAAAAAAEDPRFEPLPPREVADVDVEISVLGPLERVSSIDELEIGRHGVVVELGPRRGLLLPQVATEWGWTREEFLAQTCRKAGLRPDAWKNGATIFRFDAEVFGEEMSEGGERKAEGGKSVP